MAQEMVVRESRSLTQLIGSFLGWSHTFGVAALATLMITVSTYSESVHVAKLTILLMMPLGIHAIRYPRLLLTRDLGMYACFFAYMCVEMLWTQDWDLALNTLIPSLNFLLVMVLFSSLAAYHSMRAVLAGTLFGLLAGAALYTLTVGFPFSVPPDFSYNAIAEIYLFGLIMTLLFACYIGSRWLLLPIQILLMMLIVATTSIKTNLGVLLGVLAASLFYFRHFARLLARNVILIVALAGSLSFLILSNDKLLDILDRGFSRVSIGLEVLQAREDRPGYAGFNYRTAWEREGLAGWMQNPVFGYGVEGFRAEVGITSHSTPVDLLYNSGVIGFILFYSLFVLIILRLLRVRRADTSTLGVVTFGALVCYAFITLSATIYYNCFFAAFFALSAQLLERHVKRDPTGGPGVPAPDV
jgi:hypothetical protein